MNKILNISTVLKKSLVNEFFLSKMDYFCGLVAHKNVIVPFIKNNSPACRGVDRLASVV